jgi:hypothetical protein
VPGPVSVEWTAEVPPGFRLEPVSGVLRADGPPARARLTAPAGAGSAESRVIFSFRAGGRPLPTAVARVRVAP